MVQPSSTNAGAITHQPSKTASTTRQQDVRAKRALRAPSATSPQGESGTRSNTTRPSARTSRESGDRPGDGLTRRRARGMRGRCDGDPRASVPTRDRSRRRGRSRPEASRVDFLDPVRSARRRSTTNQSRSGAERSRARLRVSRNVDAIENSSHGDLDPLRVVARGDRPHASDGGLSPARIPVPIRKWRRRAGNVADIESGRCRRVGAARTSAWPGSPTAGIRAATSMWSGRGRPDPAHPSTAASRAPNERACAMRDRSRLGDGATGDRGSKQVEGTRPRPRHELPWRCVIRTSSSPLSSNQPLELGALDVRRGRARRAGRRRCRSSGGS